MCLVRVGEKVPFAKKGRFGVVSGSVEEYFCPFHLNIETSSRDDLSESVIMQKVNSINSGNQSVYIVCKKNYASALCIASLNVNQWARCYEC